MHPNEDSPASKQDTEHLAQSDTTDPGPGHSTGRDVLDARADEHARDRYLRHVVSQLASALQTARIGVVYKPFADAPGAITASPATFWDYLVAELSKTRGPRSFQRSERAQAGGQTDLEAFTDAPEIRTDGGIETDSPSRRLGPHRVPRIECGRCGHEHHIDAAIGEYQGHCAECSGFLRRPTDAELGKFYDFMDWKTRHAEARTKQQAPPKIQTDGGVAASDTEQCENCGAEIEGDGVYNSGGLKDSAGDALSGGESVPVSDLFEFDDGPYCSLDCSVGADTDETGGETSEVRADSGTILSESERHERGEQDVAVYECHCGASITFPERRWDGLRYITGKLGYQNIDAFIDANRTCCTRPSYTSVCSTDAADETDDENPEIRTDGGMKRIDEDENATTGDTRIRIGTGEHDTYVLRREKYGLVEFDSCGDDAFERYDWHTDETFVLRGKSEAEQFASMLSKEGAFDPNTLFFRQRTHPDNEESEDSSTTTDETAGRAE